MKPSVTNSAPVGPTARPRGSLSSAVGPGGGEPVGEIRPVAPGPAHDHADVARADRACRSRSRRCRRQQHRLVAAVGHEQVAGAVDRDGHGVPQLGRRRGAALARRAADAGAGHGVEVPGGHRLPEERGARGPAATRTRQLAVSAMNRSPARVDRDARRLVELAGRARRGRRR